MPSYPIFKDSVLRNEKCIRKLKEYKIENISANELEEILPCLTCLCFNIQATTCTSKIVSSSKALAHILPDLVCPIDNRYTLAFFMDEVKGKTEQEKFQYVIKQMWKFYQKIDKSCITLGDIFAHSFPKVFDNLIIAYMQRNVYSKNIKITN